MNILSYLTYRNITIRDRIKMLIRFGRCNIGECNKFSFRLIQLGWGDNPKDYELIMICKKCVAEMIAEINQKSKDN